MMKFNVGDKVQLRVSVTPLRSQTYKKGTVCTITNKCEDTPERKGCYTVRVGDSIIHICGIVDREIEAVKEVR